MMKIRTREAVAGYTFAFPSLVGFGMLFIVPSLISLYYCFTKGIGRTEFVGLKNFFELADSDSFRLAAGNTLRFTVISVPLITVVSFALAVLLNTKLKGIKFFRLSFILPLVVPVASVVLFWQILFHERGILNQFLNINIEWLRSEWSMGVLVLLYIWKNCGYDIILFLAGLNSIPGEYYEAAYIDGAGKWTCMVKITLPYLIPAVFFVFVISLINSFKVFREAYLLAGSYPYQDIYMLQHFMNNNFFNLNYSRLATAAFFMAVVVSVLVYAMFRADDRFGRDF